MAKRVILDTNYLVALLDTKDIWHAQVSKLSQRLEELGFEAVFLDCVVAETISVLCKRFEEKARKNELPSAIEELKQLIPKEKITWFYLAIGERYEKVLKLVKEFKGVLNFNDSIITVFAKETGLKNIISFDKDFDNVKWLKRIEKI